MLKVSYENLIITTQKNIIYVNSTLPNKYSTTSNKMNNLNLIMYVYVGVYLVCGQIFHEQP